VLGVQSPSHERENDIAWQSHTLRHAPFWTSNSFPWKIPGYAPDFHAYISNRASLIYGCGVAVGIDLIQKSTKAKVVVIFAYFWFNVITFCVFTTIKVRACFWSTFFFIAATTQKEITLNLKWAKIPAILLPLLISWLLNVYSVIFLKMKTNKLF
jgi:hypothetical protein